MALNKIVETASDFFLREKGWKLPSVAAGDAYWFRVDLPISINKEKMACFVLTSFGRLGGRKKSLQELNRSMALWMSTKHYWINEHKEDLSIFSHVHLYSEEVEVSSMMRSVGAAPIACMELAKRWAC